jgi:hypothetical protein
MKRLALAVLLCLAPAPAFADLFTLTATTTTVTVTEGSIGTIDYTFTNGSSSPLTVVSFWAGSTGVITGDSSDLPIAWALAQSPFPCSNINAGDSCKFSILIDTDSDAGETDGDQGVSLINFAINYKTQGGDSGTANSNLTAFTVVDPVPEPTSVFLFATVIAASALLMKRK